VVDDTCEGRIEV
jgi:hypothetical protein